MIILLSCGHALALADTDKRNFDEELYCGRCMRYGKVAERNAQWGWKCAGCRAGRRYGAARVTAAHAADKHVRKTGHTVHVLQGRRLDAVIRGNIRGENLFTAIDDPPPF